MSGTFCRSMNDLVYIEYKNSIQKLVAKVKEHREDLPILFSSEDSELRLYINGYVLRIKYFKGKEKAFRLVCSEKLLKNCEYKYKTPIEKFDLFLCKIGDYVNEIIDYSERNPAQEERKIETKLIAAMQKGEHNLIAVDMEVTFSRSNQYNCIIRNGKEATSNPEMDILLILKRRDKYCLLPVEVKLSNGKTIEEGPAEIASSINILSVDKIRNSICTTYAKNCIRYKELGLSNLFIEENFNEVIQYDTNWCSGVIAIIDEKQSEPLISDVVSSKNVNLNKCPKFQEFKIKKIRINTKDFVNGEWVSKLVN